MLLADREMVELNRDVDVIIIPDGTKFKLEKGERVFIQQSLGGSYTVSTEMGYMARIDGKDADSIGKEPTKKETGPPPKTPEELEKRIWEQMKSCYDPEIPVNIVDLGLIYEMKVTKLRDEPPEHKVDIQMTLTAPGCGMGPVLQEDVRTRVSNLVSVKEVNVELVLDPPWSRDRMSEAAKLELGLV